MTNQIGQTQKFVAAQGFRALDEENVLIGHDGTLRYFCELTADPDRPDVRPDLAYRQVLASMQPGWTLRLLYIAWPAPSPRQAYLQQVHEWKQPQHEGLLLLYDALTLFVESSALPFTRRTILEFSVHSTQATDAVAWWRSIPDIMAGYGVQVRTLNKHEIMALANQIFNPRL